MELSFATKLLLAAILATVLISILLIVLVPKSSQQPVQKGPILDFICKNKVATAVNNAKNQCNIQINTITRDRDVQAQKAITCETQKNILQRDYTTLQESLNTSQADLGACNTARTTLQTYLDACNTNLTACNAQITNLCAYNSYTTTFAGSTQGFVNNTGTSAQFNRPTGVAIDSSGNVFVADMVNSKIRKITPAGVVSTFAGSGLRQPSGVAVDSSGNVFVADTDNHRICKITPDGVVYIFAGSSAGFLDGTGTSAQFYYPYGVAVDSSGNVFVTDTYNHKIRKITPDSRVVSTFAGSGRGFFNGIGTNASFHYPQGVAVDSSGNVFVADTANHIIRKITPAGVVSTFAGSSAGFLDGTGASAQFDQPHGVAVDSRDNVYVADTYNSKIRKITPDSRVVSTVAGLDMGFFDGNGTSAKFNYPEGLAVDSSGNVFVADTLNHKIRKISKLSC